jgi:hypothetical protein
VSRFKQRASRSNDRDRAFDVSNAIFLAIDLQPSKTTEFERTTNVLAKNIFRRNFDMTTFTTMVALRQANKRAMAVGKVKSQARSVMNALLDSFAKACEITRGVLHLGVASAILIFYSKNMVSATIRAMLGGAI